jgi:RNA polymerase sigma-70 factor (ECF subfamily)
VLNLYQHRERYDWTEPGPLMRRSVVNEALRLLRTPRMGVVADDHPGPSASHQSPVGGMIDAETIAKVQAAIQALPDHFRAALVLCEYEQMSYVQIAELLGASVPQVKTWLHRGRRQLAAKLKDFMDVRD